MNNFGVFLANIHTLINKKLIFLLNYMDVKLKYFEENELDRMFHEIQDKMKVQDYSLHC